jgi:hypothetical protein
LGPAELFSYRQTGYSGAGQRREELTRDSVVMFSPAKSGDLFFRYLTCGEPKRQALFSVHIKR